MGSEMCIRDRPMAEPLLLLNGRLVKLGGGNFEQEIMSTLSAEVRTVTGLVRAGVLTDDAADPLEVIANATATFPRYNEALLQPAEAIHLVNLRPHRVFSQLRWMHTPPAAEASGRWQESDEEEGGEGVSHDGAAIEAIMRPVSQLLIVDLSVARHVELVSHAVGAMENTVGGRMRLAVLHSPVSGENATGRARHASAAAAWELFMMRADAAADDTGSSPSLDKIRRMLALLLTAAQAEQPLSDEMLVEALPDLFTSQSSSPLLLPTADTFRSTTGKSHADLVETISLPTSPAIVTNGRLIEADSAWQLDAIDMALLAEFEYRQRAQAPAAIIAKMQPPGATHGAEGSASASHAAAQAWRTDLMMFAAAALARGTREAAAGGAADTGFRASEIPCGAACVRLPGFGPGEALELVVILDPLSREAQRSVPVLMALQSALGLGVTLHLNPKLKIDKFPLESFYRYVVSLEPRFDESGRSLAPVVDRAVFAALRTPQVSILRLAGQERARCTHIALT